MLQNSIKNQVYVHFYTGSIKKMQLLFSLVDYMYT